MPVDPEQPSLGCIRVNWIAPPYTAFSILRCIKRAECVPELITSGTPHLFANISSNTPISSDQYISILTGDSPGLTQDEPMALVVDASDLEVASARASFRDGAESADRRN